MTLELSPQRQKWLALGLLAFFVAVAVFWVVVPAWESSVAHSERVSILKKQDLTMRGLIEARPKLEEGIAVLAANNDVQALTIRAAQPALAVAALQGQLTQIFTGVSASVTSSQVVPEVREGALTKVALQLTVEADIKALVTALHAIGSARPLLHVDRFVARDPDGDWAVNPQGQPVNKLQVEMVVSAYMGAP